MKKWDEESGLWLLTPEEFTKLPDGVILESISLYRHKVIKGKDPIDQDTRFGCLAYGLTKELVEQQGLEHDFLMLILRS